MVGDWTNPDTPSAGRALSAQVLLAEGDFPLANDPEQHGHEPIQGE